MFVDYAARTEVHVKTATSPYLVSEDAHWYVDDDGHMLQLRAWDQEPETYVIEVSRWTLRAVRAVLHLLYEADERVGRPLVRSTDHDGLRATLEWVR